MIEKQNASYKKLIRQLVIAFVFFSILFSAKQLVIRYGIEKEKDTYSTINIAGRQRMLSQKIVKDILLVQSGLGIEENQVYIADLKQSINLWDESQTELLRRCEDTRFIKKDYNEIHQMLHNIDRVYSRMLLEVRLVSDEIKYSNDKSGMNERIAKILEMEKEFLMEMDKILSQYESDAERSLKESLYANVILFWAIVAVIFFVIIKIFIPLLRNLKTALWTAKEGRVNLMKMIHTMRGVILLVNSKGEIYFKNQDAEDYILKEKNPSDILDLESSMNWKNFKIREYMNTVRRNEYRQKELEIQIGDREGRTRWIVLAAVFGKYDGEESVLIHFYDVTAQRQAEEAMKNVAIKDELTGLYNRHFLDSVVTDEFERARRYDLPLSGALLDLDHFKHVNDTWGHPVGDSVLKYTAELIHGHIRRSDYAIRIGGEEFLILMPNTDLEGAYLNAEKIRRAVEEAEYPIVGHITASLGVAERRVDDNYQMLYEKIDRALYQAKEGGRNCVTKFNEDSNIYAAVSLRWKKSWECGEKNIDHQHRELFYLLSHLMKDSLEDVDKQEVVEQVDKIIEHLLIHFDYEESVLVEKNYEDIDSHKQIHGDLIRRAHEIKSLVSQGEINGLRAFSMIFEEVVADHLLKDDIQYFSCIENDKK